MNTIVRTAALAAAIAAPLLANGAAHAGSATLELVRSSLTNVDDAAGRFQHEGGSVLKGTTTIGSYAIVRRVTTGGTDKFNTAATTVTLFFPVRAGAPTNITMQGAHDFTSGNFQGSVSGSSTFYSWIRGADAAYTIPTSGHEILVMSWTGATELKVP